MTTESETDAPGIAIVRSSRNWARTLHRYVVDHGGAIVRTRPLEERQALEDDYEILIVDDISSFLNAHIVEQLHNRGRRVLGVFDPDEHSGSFEENTGKARLLRLGVDAVIESQAAPDEFVRVIARLAPPRQERHFTPEAELDALPRDFSPAGMEEYGRRQATDSTALAKAPASRRRGHVTAVLGASGGSGATEIAIELGRAIGRRGERTVVVDGDELAPSLAQRLSLPLHPNLRTAVDVVEHNTGRLSECLTTISSGLEVLAGLPHPRDWVEVRGIDMTAVIDELARGRPQLIINTSPAIEDLTMYGGADRFGISRAVVSAADAVVLVCSPTPTGVARLLDRVADLGVIAEGKPVHVVVNRTPKSTFKRNEIALEIQRSFGPASVHFMPLDPKVERAAWEGTLVASGEFTKALGQSLSGVIPVVAFPSGSAKQQAKARKKG